jgi:hypothetical protein
MHSFELGPDRGAFVGWSADYSNNLTPLPPVGDDILLGSRKRGLPIEFYRSCDISISTEDTISLRPVRISGDINNSKS